MPVAGRLVAITGASRGLGAALALELARRGARLALLARDEARLAAVAQQARQRRECDPFVAPLDVRDWDAIERTFRAIEARCGPVDVLINAAGVKVEGAVERTERSAALEAVEVNYLGALGCCRAVLAGMRRRHAGHIVNVSSVLGKRATPQRGAYAASKAALNALTDALRQELRGTGVHVTLVCPGRFADRAEQRDGPVRLTPRTAAGRIADVVERPRRELILTPAAWLLARSSAVAPGLVDRAVAAWRRRETGRGGATPNEG
jgi:hypothetical protein